MKFAKVFQQALEENHVPDEWVARAIKYKMLKKRINKVVEELESIGISKEHILINYDIALDGHSIRPVLKLQISPLLRAIIEDKLKELEYDYRISSISASARCKKIEEAAEGEGEVADGKEKRDEGDAGEDDVNDDVNDSLELDNLSLISEESAINPFDDSEPFYCLEISLIQDSKFFQILYDEIEDLNQFQQERETELTSKVDTIAREISTLTSPNLKKSDMYIWREIFQMYIESQIFFSTSSRQTGYVDINLSKEKYTKFLQQVAKSNIINRFKQKDSQNAFMEFKRMNDEILMISNYQNFNSMAVTKILKKFDKQTHLHSKEIFPDIVIQSSSQMNILKGSVARDICAIISNNLLSIVPQIDDYLCPVCFSIAFKPIRLRCGHLFCLRCLVKLRRKLEDKCPLCRDCNLLSLTTDDLDVGQMNYMKTYFPEEVKAKSKYDDKEIIKETYGSDPDAACVIV